MLQEIRFGPITIRADRIRLRNQSVGSDSLADPIRPRINFISGFDPLPRKRSVFGIGNPSRKITYSTLLTLPNLDFITAHSSLITYCRQCYHRQYTSEEVLPPCLWPWFLRKRFHSYSAALSHQGSRLELPVIALNIICILSKFSYVEFARCRVKYRVKAATSSLAL